MPLFNVLTPVVAIIEADSADEALMKHASVMQATGHEVYLEGANTFESEDLDDRSPITGSGTSSVTSHSR